MQISWTKIIIIQIIFKILYYVKLRSICWREIKVAWLFKLIYVIDELIGLSLGALLV